MTIRPVATPVQRGMQHAFNVARTANADRSVPHQGSPSINTCLYHVRFTTYPIEQVSVGYSDVNGRSFFTHPRKCTSVTAGVSSRATSLSMLNQRCTP
jgi:hypothetical protein